MYEVLIETADRSYYTDRLAELTGKPRIYWARFPFWQLKQILAKKLREQEEVIRRE